MNNRIGDLFISTEYNETHHTNIKGEVVSCPNTPLTPPDYAEYEGFPSPSRYRSGEAIAKIASQARNQSLDTFKYLRGMYNPSAFDGDELVTNQDKEVIPEGSTIYFHYNSLGMKKDIFDVFGKDRMKDAAMSLIKLPEFKREKVWDKINEKLGLIQAVEGSIDLNNFEQVLFHFYPNVNKTHWLEFKESIKSEIDYSLVFENYIDTDSEGNKYYFINYSDVHSYKADDKMLMLNGKVLVQPKVKAHKKSVIISPNSNEVFQLHGYVRHLCPQFGSEKRDIKKDDCVIFKPNSEFKQTIEGEEYYIMKYWDIIAKLVKGQLTPLGNYIVCKPLRVYNNNALINNPVQDSLEAEVISTGHDVETLKKGDKVGYRSKYKNNGNSYIYLIRYNLFLIREEDILYTYE